MLVIFYDDDDHLLRILKTRNDPAMPAVVLLPRGMAWLVAGTNKQTRGSGDELSVHLGQQSKTSNPKRPAVPDHCYGPDAVNTG